MRLRIICCAAAMLALFMTAQPASARCGYGHGCGGYYGYTYAYPAYTYAYPYYAVGHRRCGRLFRRGCRGYRVHTVPAYTYTYAWPAYTYAYPCRRRRCW